MNWNKLSLKEKAEYIKVGVKNGLTQANGNINTSREQSQIQHLNPVGDKDEWKNRGMSGLYMTPIIGTGLAGRDFYNEPSVFNGAMLGMSALGDAAMALKGLAPTLKNSKNKFNLYPKGLDFSEPANNKFYPKNNFYDSRAKESTKYILDDLLPGTIKRGGLSEVDIFAPQFQPYANFQYKWLKARESLLKKNLIDNSTYPPQIIDKILGRYASPFSAKGQARNMAISREVPFSELGRGGSSSTLGISDQSKNLVAFNYENHPLSTNTIFHELIHNSASPQQRAEIKSILSGKRVDLAEGLEDASGIETIQGKILNIDKIKTRYNNERLFRYLVDPNEIYSRLSELRYMSGLKPTTIVTQRMLQKLKPMIEDFMLDMFNDDTLLKLLNTVAQNNSDGDNKFNYNNKRGVI